MTSPSFTRVATVTASTTRPPVISGGKAGAPATSIASLMCTRPVDSSFSKELRETYRINTLAILKEVYTQGNLDIKTGDSLVIASGDYAGTYPIRIVQMIPFGDDIRKQLIIEALVR